jgi:hypothetical protein
MPLGNLLTDLNQERLRAPDQAGGLSKLGDILFRQSVMEPGFLSSLLDQVDAPISYDNLSSLAGSRIRNMFIDPIKKAGGAIDKGMKGQPMSIDDAASLTELLSSYAVGMGAFSKVRPNVVNSIPAWHGSPHRIRGGFKNEAIGSGEGGQAFGFGHYLSDKKEIAKTYATNINPDTFRGKDLADSLELLQNKMNRVPIRSKQFKDLEEQYQIYENIALGKSKDDLMSMAESGDFGTKAKKIINSLKDDELGGSNLYKATIHKGKDPSEYNYIDWNEDISADQFKKIKKEIFARGLDKKFGYGQGQDNDLTWKTKDLYRALSNITGSEKEASAIFKKIGADGIKYRAGELSGGNIDNAFNYVVFDPKDISIDEHYINGVLQK